MTKHELYAEMYVKYLEGKSLENVARLYGITRQSVYCGFKRRNYKLREPNKRHYQILDGIKFTLRNTGYYGATTGDRILMHRYVWEKYNGKIPAGYDIHHIDHDKTNNHISNLAIYTKSDHARLFSTGRNQYSERIRKNEEAS